MSLQPSIKDVSARCAKFTSAYERAGGEIVGLMAQAQDATPKGRKKIQMEINSILRRLSSKRNSESSGLVKLAYARGLHLVDTKLKIVGSDMEAVDVFIGSLTGRLVAAERAVANSLHDYVKRLILRGLRGFDGLPVATALTDHSGRSWDLGRYSQMAISTVAHEALVHGTVTAMWGLGIEDVKVSHNSTFTISPACQPYDGMTFKMGDLDKLPPFHPGCEHFLYPA